MTYDGASYVDSEREPTALGKNGKCGSRALEMRRDNVQGAVARQVDARIMRALDWQTTG